MIISFDNKHFQIKEILSLAFVDILFMLTDPEMSWKLDK